MLMLLKLIEKDIKKNKVESLECVHNQNLVNLGMPQVKLILMLFKLKYNGNLPGIMILFILVTIQML